MGFILDAIIKKDLIGSRDDDGTTNYETINSTDTTIGADLSGSEQGYLVGLDYSNGVGTVDITFFLEGSVDGVAYGQLPDSSQQITDNSGSITWDVIDSNANFVRIGWTVVSGTLDIYGRVSAKRRH